MGLYRYAVAWCPDFETLCQSIEEVLSIKKSART